MKLSKKKKIITAIILIIFIIVIFNIIGKITIPESYHIEGKTNYITERGPSKIGYTKSFISAIEDEATFRRYFEKYPEVMELLSGVVNNDFFDNNSLIVVQMNGVQCYLSKVKINKNKVTISFKEDRNKNFNNTFFIPVKLKNIDEVEYKRIYPTIEYIFKLLPAIIFFLPIIVWIVTTIVYHIKRKKFTVEKLKKFKTKRLYLEIGAIMLWIISFAWFLTNTY